MIEIHFYDGKMTKSPERNFSYQHLHSMANIFAAATQSIFTTLMENQLKQNFDNSFGSFMYLGIHLL